LTLIRLGDPQSFDPDLSGGKGSTLSRLAEQGFPVPDGFIVSTEAFVRFLEDLGLQSEVASLCNDSVGEADLTGEAILIQQRILVGVLPNDISRAIQQMVSDYEHESGSHLSWAVRSSAVAEDMQKASFAGQYETLLGLQGGEAIAKGILTCLVSIFTPGAVRYRQERDIRDCRTAVIVQRLIDADVAGVCFTVDPISGKDRHIVINASYGLGEAVVGGKVLPDMYVIDRDSLNVQSSLIADKSHKLIPANGGVKIIPVPETLSALPCLSDKQAREIVDLALQVEAAQEHPVDIEWAFSGTKLYLLQSRPITAVRSTSHTLDQHLKFPPPDWVPETNTTINPNFPLYSRGNISEVLPGCVTPLSWDHTGGVIELAFRKQLIELGAIKEGGPQWQVLGFFYYRPYICVSFLAEAARQIPVMTPDTIYEEFIGAPESKTPPFTLVDLLPHRWPRWLRVLRMVIQKDLKLQKEVETCTQVVREEIKTYALEALSDCGDNELLDAVHCTNDLATPSAIHTWTSTFAVISFSLLRGLTKAWLNDGDSSLAAQLVTGIDHLVSAAPAFALYNLAEEIKASSELMAYFRSQKSDQEILNVLMSEAEEHPFRASLQSFLDRFGHRAVSDGEFSHPCWREDPSQVIALIRNYLRPGTISPETVRQRQQAAYKAAMTKLSALNFMKRGLLRVITERARKYITYREHMKDLSILRADRSRRVYTEIRKRLFERDLLHQPEDIFFLVWEDIKALMMGTMSTKEASEIIDRRRRDYKLCQQLSVPKLQEGIPRFLTVEDYPLERQMVGMGVSPGQVEGRARVILDPRLETRIEPGEILIAPVTDVAWTPLFLQAAGLVVEVGGLLSHGSVVAREYGLPAVVGVAGATKVIKTGDSILLDGNTGVVVKLD
jgi:phosphohistidine swiveling domain-containing protein